MHAGPDGWAAKSSGQLDACDPIVDARAHRRGGAVHGPGAAMAAWRGGAGVAAAAGKGLAAGANLCDCFRGVQPRGHHD